MPWIDLSTTSLWIDHALTWSNLQKHQCNCPAFFVDCLEAPLALLVFAGAFSCTPHCKALQGLLILLPSLRRQPGIDRIMGLNDTLGHLSEERCWLQTHIQWRWVNSQVLAFPLLFLALFFLCQTKVDAFLVSVPCQKNRFPPETTALITLTNSLKPEETSLCVSNSLYLLLTFTMKRTRQRNKTFYPNTLSFTLLPIQQKQHTSATKAQVHSYNRAVLCLCVCVWVCVLLMGDWQLSSIAASL